MRRSPAARTATSSPSATSCFSSCRSPPSSRRRPRHVDGRTPDDAVAKELALVTQAKSVCGRRASCGSSLSKVGKGRAGRRPLVSGDLRAHRDIALDERRVGAVRYVTGAFSLFPERASDSVGRLILMQDWQPTQLFLDQLQMQLLETGIATFAVALAAGLVFSKRMSRPLKDIAAAAGDIASGNWARQVPVRGSAEATTMALAFNEMSTGLRHWHQEARDKSERLQKSYDRFYSVTESARDAIISTDETGAITFWSRSAETIFGYPEAEALGQPLTRFIVESDRQAYLEALTAIRSGESGMAFGRTIEIVGAQKNGNRFPIELSLSAWEAAGSTNFTVVVRDVTERRQARRAPPARGPAATGAENEDRPPGRGLPTTSTTCSRRSVVWRAAPRRVDKDDAAGDADGIISGRPCCRPDPSTPPLPSRRQVLMPQVLALEEVVARTENVLHRLIGEDIELTLVSQPASETCEATQSDRAARQPRGQRPRRDASGGGHIELDQVGLDGSAVRTARRCAWPLRQASVTDTGSGMTPDVVAHIRAVFTTKEEGKGTGLGWRPSTASSNKRRIIEVEANLAPAPPSGFVCPGRRRRVGGAPTVRPTSRGVE